MTPLYRQARRRGLVGGSRPWTVVWAVALAVRVARRLLRAKPEVLYSARLAPGETLEIAHRADPAVKGQPGHAP